MTLARISYMLTFFISVLVNGSDIHAMFDHDAWLLEMERKTNKGFLRLPTGDNVRLRVCDTIHTPLGSDLIQWLYKKGFVHLVENSDLIWKLSGRDIWPQQAFDCFESEFSKYCADNPLMHMEIHKPVLLKIIFKNQKYIIDALEEASFLQKEAEDVSVN